MFKLNPAMLVPEKANNTNSITGAKISFVFIFSPSFLFTYSTINIWIGGFKKSSFLLCPPVPTFNTRNKGGSIWGRNIHNNHNRDACNDTGMVSHNNKEQEYILRTLSPKEAKLLK